MGQEALDTFQESCKNVLGNWACLGLEVQGDSGLVTVARW